MSVKLKDDGQVITITLQGGCSFIGDGYNSWMIEGETSQDLAQSVKEFVEEYYRKDED